jgi:AraC-like DNA-binding protein
MPQPIVVYREFAPCPVLREHVLSFFSFTSAHSVDSTPRRRVIREAAFGAGDPFSSPLFADGHVSLTLNLNHACTADGRWIDSVNPAATVIGAMSAVGPARPPDRAEMVGAYFRAGGAAALIGAPSSAVTDQIVALDDLWGAAATNLSEQLCADGELARVDRLERALLARLGRAASRATSFDCAGLASWVVASRGQLTVDRMADAAGVSRQCLSRRFRATIGVTPKLYCMLARFQAGLAHAGRGANVDWAHAAADLGYADQSHMIREFRRFSSLTPAELASGRWWHPFIARARSALR